MDSETKEGTRLIERRDENGTSLVDHLSPIQDLLDDDSITEITINDPGAAWTEGREGWKRHSIPALTLVWASQLSKLMANYIGKSEGKVESLPGTLPTGQRVHVVKRPRIGEGKISVTIRRPSKTVFTLDEMADRGVFNETVIVQSREMSEGERAEIERYLSEEDKQLLSLLNARKFVDFLKTAVLLKKNQILSGATGSGKTTLTNAIISHIPADERIVTAEDTPEIRLPHLKQHVQMFYDKNKPGSVTSVFEDTLRMYPSRVLPAELRGGEAYYFINNVLNSGHPGTVTTVHANSTKLAFLRLALMIQSSAEGAALNLDSIKAMLYSLIDVVTQMNQLDDKRRVVREIYFDPAYALKQMG